MQKYGLKEYSENSIDFSEFISNYNLTYNVDDDGKIRKLVLLVCLKDNARYQYKELFNNDQFYDNCGDFRAALEPRIFPDGIQRLLRRAIYDRVQRRLEVYMNLPPLSV